LGIQAAPNPTEEFLGQCNRVVVMAEGRVVADCSPADLEKEKRHNPQLQVLKQEAFSIFLHRLC
jgi:ABC-type sugar transport system ATPase subunit